jgi:hypothetical protein
MKDEVTAEQRFLPPSYFILHPSFPGIRRVSGHVKVSA